MRTTFFRSGKLVIWNVIWFVVFCERIFSDIIDFFFFIKIIIEYPASFRILKISFAEAKRLVDASIKFLSIRSFDESRCCVATVSLR